MEKVKFAALAAAGAFIGTPAIAPVFAEEEIPVTAPDSDVLEDTAAENQTAVEQAENHLADAQADLDAANKSLDTAEAEYHDQYDQASDAKADYENAYQSRLDDLSAQEQDAKTAAETARKEADLSASDEADKKAVFDAALKANDEAQHEWSTAYENAMNTSETRPTQEDLELAQSDVKEAENSVKALTKAEQEILKQKQEAEQKLSEAVKTEQKTSELYEAAQSELEKQSKAAQEAARKASELAAIIEGKTLGELKLEIGALEKELDDQNSQLAAIQEELSEALAKKARADELVSDHQVSSEKILAEKKAAEEKEASLASELESAEAELRKASAAVDQAKEILEAAGQSAEDAKKAADDLQAEAEKMKAALDAARAESEQIQKEADNAIALLEERLKEIQDLHDSGSIGFFNYIRNLNDQHKQDAEAALQVFADSRLADETNIGLETDGTSLSNMLKALPYLNQLNELRAINNLDPLRITLYDMAAAQKQVNWTAVHHTHAQVFGLCENIAVGRSNPFAMWYDQEKELYDQLVEDYGFTRAQIHDKYFSVVGHYLNITNSSYKFAGFGITTSSSYPYYSNTFNYGSYGGGYTLEEFTDLVNNYIDSVNEDLTQAKKALEDQTVPAEIQEKLDAASTRLQNAKADYENAQNAAANASADAKAREKEAAEAEKSHQASLAAADLADQKVSQISNAQSDHTKIQNEIEERLNASLSELSLLNSQAASAADSVTQTQVKMTSQTDRIGALNSQLETLQNAIINFDRLDEAKAALEEAQKLLEEAEKNYETADEARIKAFQNAEAARESFTLLHNQHTQTAFELDAKKDQLEEANYLLQRLQNNIKVDEEAQKALAEAEKKSLAALENLIAAEQELKQASQSTTDAKAYADQALAEHASVKAEADELKKQLAAFELGDEFNFRKWPEIEEKANLVLSAQEKLNDAFENLSHAQNELQRAQAAWNEAKAKLEKALESSRKPDPNLNDETTVVEQTTITWVLKPDKTTAAVSPVAPQTESAVSNTVVESVLTSANELSGTAADTGRSRTAALSLFSLIGMLFVGSMKRRKEPIE